MPGFDGWNSELYHHGIIGMKWGVRRYQNKDGTRTAAGRARERLQDLSDSELESRLKRLRNEKEYKELTKSSVARAVDYVRKFNKELNENRANKAKLISAKVEKKKSNIVYQLASKAVGGVTGAAVDVATGAIKKAGNTLIGAIPTYEQTKNAAKKTKDFLKKTGSVTLSSINQGVNHAASKAIDTAMLTQAYYSGNKKDKHKGNGPYQKKNK